MLSYLRIFDSLFLVSSEKTIVVQTRFIHLDFRIMILFGGTLSLLVLRFIWSFLIIVYADVFHRFKLLFVIPSVFSRRDFISQVFFGMTFNKADVVYTRVLTVYFGFWPNPRNICTFFYFEW